MNIKKVIRRIIHITLLVFVIIIGLLVGFRMANPIRLYDQPIWFDAWWIYKTRPVFSIPPGFVALSSLEGDGRRFERGYHHTGLLFFNSNNDSDDVYYYVWFSDRKFVVKYKEKYYINENMHNDAILQYYMFAPLEEMVYEAREYLNYEWKDDIITFFDSKGNAIYQHNAFDESVVELRGNLECYFNKVKFEEILAKAKNTLEID